MGSKWNPNMDEAPKDGTEILVFVQDDRPPEKRMCVAFFVQNPDGTSRWALMQTATQNLCLSQLVTHWMPLPDPPLPEFDGTEGADHE